MKFKLTLINTDTFQIKSATKHLFKLYTFWFILGIALGTGILYSFREDPKPIVKYKFIFIHDTIQKEKDIRLTKDEIVAELVKQKCIQPSVAYAQFLIESEHFKSPICKENKNFAGIRNSSSKYVIGKNRGHSVYKTYRDCIKDYIRIQNRLLGKMDRVYAEDSLYIPKLRKMPDLKSKH